MKIAKILHDSQTRWCEIVNGGEIRLFPEKFNLAEYRRFTSQGSSLSLDRTTIAPPTVSAPKIICIGKNYADHAAEMGGEVPELPIVFSKFPTSLAGPYADIVLPEISQQVDYEAELVVVIGKAGKHIPIYQASQHILGYMCGNDVSARDWQKGRPGGQWLVGKSFDTFAPVGPWITTADEVSNPGDLVVQLRLNDRTMQQASTRLLIYPIPELISYLSKFFTLDVGDLIFTGTPAGVGAGRNPPVFLQAGDIVEVEISGLGSLRNRCVAENVD